MIGITGGCAGLDHDRPPSGIVQFALTPRPTTHPRTPAGKCDYRGSAGGSGCTVRSGQILASGSVAVHPPGTRLSTPTHGPRTANIANSASTTNSSICCNLPVGLQGLRCRSARHPVGGSCVDEPPDRWVRQQPGDACHRPSNPPPSSVSIPPPCLMMQENHLSAIYPRQRSTAKRQRTRGVVVEARTVAILGSRSVRTPTTESTSDAPLFRVVIQQSYRLGRAVLTIPMVEPWDFEVEFWRTTRVCS